MLIELLGLCRWFHLHRNAVSPLQRSGVSSARNAGKVAFFDFEVQPSAERSRVSIAQGAGKVVFSDFEVQPSAEIARVDRAECW